MGLVKTAVVINLPRRPDRLELFLQRWADARPEGIPVEVFPAIDTGTAHGCLASHIVALYTYPGPLLVLEDDAVFCPSFTLDLQPPQNWDVLWLGGQHRQRPAEVNSQWVRPLDYVRTHAYIARRPRELSTLLRKTRPPRLDPYLAALPLNQYALVTHTVGQAAGTSDIDGDVRLNDCFWNRAEYGSIL